MLDTLLAIIEDGYDVLWYYTVSVLMEFCDMFSLPKSGRKQTLINRIWDYVTSFTFPESNVYVIGNDIIPFITRHNLHIGLSRSIVRKIASRPITDNGYGNASMQACLHIMNSNFKEPIFEDICQEMFVYLMKCVNDKTVYIQNSHIRFSSPTFEDNDAYLGCFKVVYNVLKSYSSNANQISKCVGEYITIYDDDDDEKELSVKSSRYISELCDMCGLYDIECIDNIKKFFMWARKKYGVKRSTGMLQIIIGRFEGLKDYEISNKYGISKRSVERFSALLKVVYSEYSKECDDFKFVKPSFSATYGGYQKNAITNNGFQYGDMFESELDKYANTTIIPEREYVPLPKSKTMTEVFMNEYETKKALKKFYGNTCNINSAFFGYRDNISVFDFDEECEPNFDCDVTALFK